MTLTYTNGAISPLMLDVDDNDTTLTVRDGSLYPTANFYICLDDEIMLVTGRSSNDLTVTRAQQGTVAVSHVLGTLVELMVTQVEFDHHRKYRDIYNNRAGIAAYKNNVFYGSNSQNEAYYDGSNWHSRLHKLHVTDFIDTTFTWLNQGTSTISSSERGYMNLLAPASASNNIRARVKTIATAPYKWTILFSMFQNVVNFQNAGMILRDSASGKIITFCLNESNILRVFKFNSATSFDTAYTIGSWRSGFNTSSGLYLRIHDDNTNRHYQFSMDKVYWHNVLTTLRTDWITPDQMGYYANSVNSHPVRVFIQSWEEEPG